MSRQKKDTTEMINKSEIPKEQEKDSDTESNSSGSINNGNNLHVLNF